MGNQEFIGQFALKKAEHNSQVSIFKLKKWAHVSEYSLFRKPKLFTLLTKKSSQKEKSPSGKPIVAIKFMLAKMAQLGDLNSQTS